MGPACRVGLGQLHGHSSIPRLFLFRCHQPRFFAVPLRVCFDNIMDGFVKYLSHLLPPWLGEMGQVNILLVEAIHARMRINPTNIRVPNR